MGGNRFYCCIMVVVGLFMGACASTTNVRGVWKDDAYTGGPLNKVLVIGVLQKDVIRRKVEDEFVRQLKARKVDAVASYRAVPVHMQLSKEYILSKVKELDVDAILVTRVIEKAKEEFYEPGRSYAVPQPYYRNWHGYYSRSYRQVHAPAYRSSFGVIHEPGRRIEREIYNVETNVYQVQSEKLVFTVMTDTTNELPVDETIASFTKIVLQQLSAENLIHR